MPVCLHHDPNYILNIFIRHVGLKEIAHAVNKNRSWTRPVKRLREFIGDQTQIKSLLVWMIRNSSKSLGKNFRIAMLAAGADLCATPKGVPWCGRPLDLR